MTEEKKHSVKRQTKAGLMEKNGRKIKGEKDIVSTEDETEKTPKISKDEAEDAGRERPLH